MAARLPEGLITTVENLGENLRSADRVDPETLRRLWHVYHVHSRLLDQNDVAQRMENYFWRIWSNRNIHSVISGRTVARLFEAVADDGNRIRTTPTASPIPRTAPSYLDHNPLHRPRGDVHAGSGRGQAIVGQPRPHQPSTPARDRSSRQTSEPFGSSPTPTLRTTSMASTRTSGSTRSSSPGNASIDSATTIVADPSATGSTLSSPKPTPRGAGPSERKKIGTAKSKGRPTLGRNKSSQGAVPTVRKPPVSPGIPPRRDQKASVSYSDETGDILEAEGSGAALGRAELSSSWQDMSPSDSREIGRAGTKPSSWLVDKDFRDRFAEQQKRGASHGHLPSLSKSSSVRFMAELPDRSKGKQRYSEIDTHGNVIRGELRRKEFATKRSEELGQDESAIEDDGGSPLLGRTKSSLSLMIERERRMSGSLPREPPPNADESVDPVRPPSSTDEDDDDEYFVMGMGVTQTKVRTGSSKKKGKRKSKADEPPHGSTSTARPPW